MMGANGALLFSLLIYAALIYGAVRLIKYFIRCLSQHHLSLIYFDVQSIYASLLFVKHYFASSNFIFLATLSASPISAIRNRIEVPP